MNEGKREKNAKKQDNRKKHCILLLAKVNYKMMVWGDRFVFVGGGATSRYVVLVKKKSKQNCSSILLLGVFLEGNEKALRLTLIRAYI